MTTHHHIDPQAFLSDLAQSSPEYLRTILKSFIGIPLAAGTDNVCGAAYDTRTEDRTDQRNSYRRRDLDTRAGSLNVVIPKLGESNFLLESLLQRQRRAEVALTTVVVAHCYLMCVTTRRMDNFVQMLGITSLLKSQVSEMSKGPEGQTEAFHTRPLDERALPLLRRRCARTEGRTRAGGQGGVHSRNRQQQRRLPRNPQCPARHQRDQRRLADVRARLGRPRPAEARLIITSDAHAGLVEAAEVVLPATVWKRFRTHYAAHLMSVCRSPNGRQPKLCCPACARSQSPMRCARSISACSTHPTRTWPLLMNISRPPATISWRS